MRMLAIALAWMLGGDAGLAQAPLPPALASLLELQRSPRTVGPLRGSPCTHPDQRRLGLPAYTAWAAKRFTLRWDTVEPPQRGRLTAGGTETEATGNATLGLPAGEVSEWQLRLTDGRCFSGRLRRLAATEAAAVTAALDRAAAAGGDPAQVALQQLETYAVHELYASALGFLDRRPELAAQEPFRSLRLAIAEAMSTPRGAAGMR